MPEPTEIAADPVLVDAVDLARDALAQITSPSSIGRHAGYTVEEEHVVSHRFACDLAGYPGWNWTVTVGRVDEASEPTVLEAELLPGDDALLAPDWVPWSERLAEYQASLEAARAEQADDADAAGASTDDEADDEDDLDDADDDDLDEGDIDGVDIDELHDADEEADDSDDDPDADYEAEEITGAELAALDLQIDETDGAEGDTDQAGPQPPLVARGGEGAPVEQQGDEGDQPQR